LSTEAEVQEFSEEAGSQAESKVVPPKPRKKRARKSASKKTSRKAPNAAFAPDEPEGKRSRRTLLFPAGSFEEALTVPLAIQKHAGGQKVRRLTLFDQMKKSPDSGPSRQLVINANKYGLIKGNYTSEHLELTPNGEAVTADGTLPKDKLSASFKLAIEGIPPFKALYERLKGNRVPAPSVMEDIARENGIPAEDAPECVETFVVNAKSVGILKPIAGAERIIPIEQVIEELPSSGEHAKIPDAEASTVRTNQPTNGSQSAVEHDFANVCFYISPIGDEGSEQRKHADLFLGSLVEPALEEFGLKVVRADKIGKAGMITAQILEYILKSKLVIADLSFHNPNVFYELSLRHVSRLPTVQVIRKCDRIPFDIDGFRTIKIDTTDIFTMVPNLQTYKTEIAAQVRSALKNPDSVDNPLTTYYPNLAVQLN
jgi:hypothetical protein